MKRKTKTMINRFDGNKRIRFLLIAVILIMSAAVEVPMAKAKEESYTFESGISPRTISYFYTSELTFFVDNVYYKISLDPDPIKIAYCDKYGTLWLLSSFEDPGFMIYWVNYELEGKNMTPHYFNTGSFFVNSNFFVYAYSNNITDEEFPLPTFDDLKNYLENGVPVPGSKPKPVTDLESSTNSKPATVPNSLGKKEAKKVTTSKNTIKLIDSNNKVMDKVTFNKKKATLSYNGKKVTEIKGVWFTKKGNLVYLKKNSKAYYLKGKKSKLIKSKVASVRTYKKFATALKLKNGKAYQLK